MLMRKQKIDVELPLPRVSERQYQLFEVLIGKRSSKKFYNASGLLLNNQTALLKVGDERSYVVAIAVGDRLYKAKEVATCHPAIRSINHLVTVFGNSPEEMKIKEIRRRRSLMSSNELELEEIKLRRSWGQTVRRPMGGASTNDHTLNYNPEAQKALL